MIQLTPHQKKALFTDGHLALTANAGSGKTFVLARKYLSILQKEDIEVTNVAAITFTEKAASELYSKISLLIDDNLKTDLTFPEKKKLEKIRRQLVSANISTIHSFCIDILKQFPVQAKLDARFTPIDANLSNELIEISVEEMIRGPFENESLQNDLKYLIRILGSKNNLESEIVSLIKNRKTVFAVQEIIYSNDLNSVQKYFADTFNKYFLLIWKRNKNELIKSLSTINSAVLENDSNNNSAQDVQKILTRLESESDVKQIISLLNQIRSLAFTKSVEIRTRGYLNKDQFESLNNEIIKSSNIMSELSVFDIQPEQKEIEKELSKFGLTVIKFFNIALNNYEVKKQNEGFVDFEDLLLHTKTLLSNDDVKKTLYEKYKYILVDEFQDTNEIQYQIFLPILNYLKSGNLIIVGDEKQSIYKFRNAEIEVFNLTKSQIEGDTSSDNVLSLPDSFRMAPAICVFTNSLFNKLFLEPDELYNEVSNNELVCARQDGTKGKVEFIISKINDSENFIEEAELVARKILSIVSEGNYSFKDVCILVRKRKNFDELEKAFLPNKIPYTIIGGRGFYQRQIINDVYNYLSFLVDVNNSAALVGLLRSPFFTFSDSELFEISLSNGNSFWNKLKDFTNRDSKYLNVVQIMKENILLSDSLELPQLLKKMVTDQNYLSVISSRIDGDQELANFEKLLSISRNFNSKGFRNLYDFINYLKESITGIDDEEQATFSIENNSVQMMTIHQAKGLEFPIVFLFKTSDRGSSNIIKTGQIQVDKTFGLLSKVPINENYFEEYSIAPIVSVYNYIESKKNLAELKRLLYVGVTRAKDELYISASIDKETSLPKESFISLLGLGLNTQFDTNDLIISDELKFLVEKNGEFLTETKPFKISIPITKQIKLIEEIENEFKNSEKDYKVQLEILDSNEKGEIISASKVSIFNQCPLKYSLIYDYGFSKLNTEISKSKNAYLSNFLNMAEEDEQDETKNAVDIFNDYDAADKGKLIHYILENEISPEQIDGFLKNITLEDKSFKEINQNTIDSLKNDLAVFYNSSVYNRIKSFKEYKNEFEIYIKDEDYFLHGIVDKLVYDGKKIIIFDYKTDNIEEKEVKNRGEYYLIQLKFYLYIASKLFNEFETFEGNLIFIKHPERILKIQYDVGKLSKLQGEIKSIINDLRHKKKEKKLTHCKQCVFSNYTNNCIIN